MRLHPRYGVSTIAMLAAAGYGVTTRRRSVERPKPQELPNPAPSPDVDPPATLRSAR